MINHTLVNIFKKGSTTYFTSSLFFPIHKRKDVFALYAFVRKADDFVDSIPQDKISFNNFYKEYKKRLHGFNEDTDLVIDSFIELKRKYLIPDIWVESFFFAMRSDTKVHIYKTRKQLGKYMFGSAEVIGLMMAKILDLSKESYDSARLLGKSMQLANFIRDIQVDIELCRQYLPYEDLSLFRLTSLMKKETIKKRENFIKLVRHEISWYKEIRKMARSGFDFIPYRYRIPIETASDMYDWTMEEISKDPFIVYSGALKPNRVQIINTALSKSITLSKLGSTFSKYESL